MGFDGTRISRLQDRRDADRGWAHPKKIHDVFKVTLGWYDRFLGPVTTTG